MKTSSELRFRSKGGKIMVCLVLAAMIGSINVAQSLGEDHNQNDHNRSGKHDNGRYEHKGQGHDHERYERDRRVYHPYGYREPVYYPPPVYYEPPPPPGISIFFPSIVIHP